MIKPLKSVADKKLLKNFLAEKTARYFSNLPLLGVPLNLKVIYKVLTPDGLGNYEERLLFHLCTDNGTEFLSCSPSKKELVKRSLKYIKQSLEEKLDFVNRFLKLFE